MKMFFLKLILAFFVITIMSALTWIWAFNSIPFFRDAKDGYESNRAMGLAVGSVALWVGLAILVW
jgi:hypothetical protein